MNRAKWSPRIIATGVLASAVILGGLTAGRADAATYTGCLNNGGSITRVAIGTSPRGACSPGETQISWNATGPAGVVGFYKVTDSFNCAGPGSCLIDPLPIAHCHAGDVATGGAAYRTVPGFPLQQFVAVPFPTIDLTSNPPTGFTVTPQTVGAGDTVYVVAICAELP